MLKGLSMFANVGIAETYFDEEGIDVVVANELIPERAKFYEHLHPKTKMICGDITDKSIFNEIINESIKQKVNFIIATPPCQGMSLNGNKDPNDKRNYLIISNISSFKINISSKSIRCSICNVINIILIYTFYFFYRIIY